MGSAQAKVDACTKRKFLRVQGVAVGTIHRTVADRLGHLTVEMAARRGFEPRLTGPGPVVLPLHHRARMGCVVEALEAEIGVRLESRGLPLESRFRAGFLQQFVGNGLMVSAWAKVRSRSPSVHQRQEVYHRGRDAAPLV